MKTVIANFKMNKTNAEVKSYIDDFKSLTSNLKASIILCPPGVSITCAKARLGDSKIMLGIQNINENDEGAYTGEISAKIAAGCGAKYAVVGHSERRIKFLEKDAQVNKKVLKALSAGLNVILCVGENLSERDTNATQEVLEVQLQTALSGVYDNELKNIILAYEPVWAIGTGVVATNVQIGDTIEYIRGVIEKLYNKETSDKTTIVYGGSVNEKNANEIAKIKGVDGVLVGRASLIPQTFTNIIKAFI